MKYINYLSKGIDNVNNFKDRKIPYEMIKNSKVASSLKYYGYKYVHFKSTWGPTDYNPYADINLGGPHSLVLSQLNNEFNMVIARSTILREWLKKNNSDQDETIYDFFSRRFGKKITDTFVDPLVLGIYGGDSKKLSMQTCFPKVFQWEKEYGSVLKEV